MCSLIVVHRLIWRSFLRCLSQMILLWALDDTTTYPFIEYCFNNKKPLGQAIHRKTMNIFRQYMLVGGMPQSVLAYIKNKDFEASDTVKKKKKNINYLLSTKMLAIEVMKILSFG